MSKPKRCEDCIHASNIQKGHADFLVVTCNAPVPAIASDALIDDDRTIGHKAALNCEAFETEYD